MKRFAKLLDTSFESRFKYLMFWDGYLFATNSKVAVRINTNSLPFYIINNLDVDKVYLLHINNVLNIKPANKYILSDKGFAMVFDNYEILLHWQEENEDKKETLAENRLKNVKMVDDFIQKVIRADKKNLESCEFEVTQMKTLLEIVELFETDKKSSFTSFTPIKGYFTGLVKLEDISTDKFVGLIYLNIN